MYQTSNITERLINPSLLRLRLALRKKRPYLEFFWFVFSHIRTEHEPEKHRIWTLFAQCKFIISPRRMMLWCENWFISFILRKTEASADIIWSHATCVITVMEIAKDNLKKSWHWLNWQNWIGREQNKHVTTKTAYQSGLKGRGRLRKLHWLIWILPLLSKLIVINKKVWRKKKWYTKDLKRLELII